MTTCIGCKSTSKVTKEIEINGRARSLCAECISTMEEKRAARVAEAEAIRIEEERKRNSTCTVCREEGEVFKLFFDQTRYPVCQGCRNTFLPLIADQVLGFDEALRYMKRSGELATMPVFDFLKKYPLKKQVA